MSFDVGQAHVLLVKSAAGGKPATTHALSGELYLSRSGWLLLQVPNALVRGAFSALNEPGVELPPSGPDDTLNAHISVMRPAELEELGLTGEGIKERGQHFSYTLGPVQSVTPNSWAGISKVWFIKVNSPELKKLRRTYGMTSLPNGGEFDFHISIAVRRKGVLFGKGTRKAASLIHGGNVSEYFSSPRAHSSGRQGGVSGRGSGCGVRGEGAEGVPAWQAGGHVDGVHQCKVAGAGTDGESQGQGGGNPAGVPITTPVVGQQDAENELTQLQQAKSESDRSNYGVKYMLLRQLIRRHPEAFAVDSPVGKYHGVTHSPTGFQFHMPPAAYSGLIKASALGYAVRDSDIHGQGTFATRKYEPGDRVGLALQLVKEDDEGQKEFDRTVLGRFVNYQPDGNVVLQEENGNLYLHAVTTIAEDAEMFTQPYEDELAPFGPLMINQGYKQAEQVEVSDDDFWSSPTNKDGRRCPGCDQLFKECEPLAGVEMCETCERFGPVKKVAATVITVGVLEKARKATAEPTSEAQADAGNYKKGHLSWQGLSIAIENPKGSTRSGTSPDGKTWSQKMQNDYGYFKGSIGKDKDHVDVFIGPDLDSELVFVVNQLDVGTQKFDEHKCVICTTSEEQARKTYLANYEDGWQGLGSVTAMTVPDFKKWVLDHKQTVKAAFNMQGSWYGDAAKDYTNNLLAGRGQLWDNSKGVWGNVKRHIGGVSDMASDRIGQAASYERLRGAMDPKHSLQQLSSYLSGQRKPIVRHPVDAILHGRFGQ